MSSKIILAIIVGLLSTIVCCQYREDVHLVNQLSEFFRFDHHIYLMESGTDLNRWFLRSSLRSETKPNNIQSQTVYTFDDHGHSYIDGNKTDQVALDAIVGKNTFLVVVGECFQFKNDSEFVAQVKAIRNMDINVKIGVFFSRNITSLDIIEQLFRWSWSAGIVNIFVAFYLNANDGGTSFKVFKYNPFGTFDLVNVTRSGSLQDYFSSKVPNYQKHPLRAVMSREFMSKPTDIEVQFWETVTNAFNASMSKIYTNNAEFGADEREDVDIYLHEIFLQKHVQVYPHRQSMLVMIVPHAQPYTDFATYLQNGTWTLLFVSAFIVVATSSLLLIASGRLQKKKILPLQCIIDVSNLLMNDNTGIRYRNLHRADIFVIVPLTFTGLIVMNGVVSLFQSFITSPIYQLQINSLKDLYASSVPILANELGWIEHLVALLEDITRYGGWRGKSHGTNLKQLLSEVHTFNNSIAFFLFDYDARLYLELQQRLALKAYHLLSDKFFNRYLHSYIVSPQFPYTEHLSNIVHRLIGAGLIDKWEQKEQEERMKSVWKINFSIRRSRAADVSTIGKLYVPTVVWCGWIASLIVFICEIIWSKVKSWKLSF